MAKKPVVLIIRDGWGVNPGGKATAAKDGNATLLARTPFPQRVFPSDAECLAWCSEKLGASAADSADLGTFLAGVRRSAVEHQLVTA